MSGRGIEMRLARLKARLDVGNDLRHLTDDELQIRLLDACRAVLSQPVVDATTADAEWREKAAECVAEVEAGIQAQAEMRRRPEYAEHLAWVRGKRAEYVPAICGFIGRASSMAEYGDLDRPNIMARRAAIFARPDIQVLVGAEGG